MLENGATILSRDWKRLCDRHNGVCAYCQIESATEQDHVIPLSRGGRHAIGNVLPACRSCNASKNAQLLIEWDGRPRNRWLIPVVLFLHPPEPPS